MSAPHDPAQPLFSAPAADVQLVEAMAFDPSQIARTGMHRDPYSMNHDRRPLSPDLLLKISLTEDEVKALIDEAIARLPCQCASCPASAPAWRRLSRACAGLYWRAFRRHDRRGKDAAIDDEDDGPGHPGPEFNRLLRQLLDLHHQRGLPPSEAFWRYPDRFPKEFQKEFAFRVRTGHVPRILHY